MVAEILNNTPHSILGFRTPREVHENIDLNVIKSESRMKSAMTAAESFSIDYGKQLNIALRY